MRRSAVFALTLSLVASACEPAPAPGRACARSSECTSPLVCGNARCRVECIEHRDCPIATRCIAAHDGLGVCTLPDDGCSAAAPCQGDLECRRGGCYDACATATCPANGVCIAGVCERPGDEGVDAAVADGGTDGGASVFPQHRACPIGDECLPSEACVQILAGRHYCRPRCAVDAECSEADTENACVFGTAMPGPDIGVCGVPCELYGDSSDCGAGEACDILELRNTQGSLALLVECRPVAPSPGVQDAPCDTGDGGYDARLCARGFDCDGVAPGYTCQQLCTVFEELGDPCPTGTTCEQAGGTPLRFRSAAIGTCAPPS